MAQLARFLAYVDRKPESFENSINKWRGLVFPSSSLDEKSDSPLMDTKGPKQGSAGSVYGLQQV